MEMHLTADNSRILLGQLDALRRELSDLAYTLECRGRLDAADLAVTIAARLRDLGVESTATGPLREFRAIAREASGNGVQDAFPAESCQSLRSLNGSG